MKTLIVMVMVLFGFQLSAQVESEKPQKPHEPRPHLKDLSPEEMATLKTKRMTLDLNLNTKQRDEIYYMNLENIKQRRDHGKRQQKLNGEDRTFTKEQRFAAMNSRLDRQIEQKNKMRRILDQDQFKRWERQSYRGKRKGPVKNRRIRKRH